MKTEEGKSSNRYSSRKGTKRRVHSDILLVGQPNVGKSVLFSRITGVRTIASNYPGTTVSYAVGKTGIGKTSYTIVDAPGTYSLSPLDEAARVTVDLIGNTGQIINVIDASHLERHLPLTLELLAQEKPLVVALNMSDEARHKGISIDAGKLSARLGVPVVPITARSGEGVKQLISISLALGFADDEGMDKSSHPECPSPARRQSSRSPSEEHGQLHRDRVWLQVGEIVDEVQTIAHHHYSFGEWLEAMSVHPLWGSVIAVLVIATTFFLIRLLGEFLIGGGIGIAGQPWIELPFGTELLFEKAVKPLLMKLSGVLRTGGFLQRLLLGSLIDGEIDFMQSFGLLTSGLYIPLGAVLPYLISYYFVLSLLEDIGYLPRLAVFVDNVMHLFGLHGYAIIPTLLGLGCNVPGVMATRILEGKRQRFITATLISIAVPCAALQAMIVGMVGERGILPILLVYGILFTVWLLISLVLRFTSRAFRPELIVEIPPYRLPSPRALLSKMWMRISGFLREALPIIMTAVLVVNILYQFKMFEALARIAEPVVTRLWGMPRESMVPLLVGILRKDVALGMFAPLELTTKQLIIGTVLLSMFFPCIATFVVLFRELGLKDGFKSLGIMLLSVLLTGSVLNLIL